MTVEAMQAPGVVRVARQVLSTIVINTALQIPGIVAMAQGSDPWSRRLRRTVPKHGVALTVKDNTVSADLYIIISTGSDIVAVGRALQEEVASALELMIGMQVQQVNIYVQDIV